ncbi:uncharacterized protein P884DRAFT_87596 [Thermothelomyces heterothallicus CBS 202.75]|uniref:uncharacterized protein n=1 Tax=Thermothelomyces heterothallicus CBS 202.75 TaxID=1149848 RepID=UPI003743613F
MYLDSIPKCLWHLEESTHLITTSADRTSWSRSAAHGANTAVVSYLVASPSCSHLQPSSCSTHLHGECNLNCGQYRWKEHRARPEVWRQIPGEMNMEGLAQYIEAKFLPSLSSIYTLQTPKPP